MKVSIVTLATVAGLVTLSGPSFADSLFGIIPLPSLLNLPILQGAPAPALAAGIPSLIAIGGAFLASKFVSRRRG